MQNMGPVQDTAANALACAADVLALGTMDQGVIVAAGAEAEAERANTPALVHSRPTAMCVRRRRRGWMLRTCGV
jgi:hypothetical protein